MTYNEILNLCKSVCSKKSRLKALQSYIGEERALIENVGAVNSDSLGVVSSAQNGTEERYAKHMDRLVQLQSRFDALFDEMCEEEDKLNELMQRLSPTEYEVILNRYLRGMSVLKTARIMDYSEGGIKHIQERAFKKMIKTNYEL